MLVAAFVGHYAPPDPTPLAAEPGVAHTEILGRLRAAMRNRIAERADAPSPAVAELVAMAATEGGGSWEKDEEARDIARGKAAWLRATARNRRRLAQSQHNGSEGIFGIFLATTVISSLAFFVFDFASWDCA
jgi:hypothetical protein